MASCELAFRYLNNRTEQNRTEQNRTVRPKKITHWFYIITSVSLRLCVNGNAMSCEKLSEKR